MSISTNFNVEKLMGRENYASWSFAMKNLLQHEELWETVQGVYPETGINVKADTKAKAKIILMVDKLIMFISKMP